MIRFARIPAILALALAAPAAAQEVDFAALSAEAADAGWSLMLTPDPAGAQIAWGVVMQRDDLRLEALSLTVGGDGTARTIFLQEAVLTQSGRQSASGSITAMRLMLSDFGALGVLGAASQIEPMTADLCARSAGQPMSLLAEAMEMIADPDAMAPTQTEPERLSVARLSVRAARQGDGPNCSIALDAEAEGLQLRLPGDLRAEMSGFSLRLSGDPELSGAYSAGAEVRDIRTWEGSRSLMAIGALALEMSQSGLVAVADAVSEDGADVAAGLSAAEARFRFDLRDIDLPLRDLMPGDLAVPEDILVRTPQERIAGSMTLEAEVMEGTVELRIEARLAGLTELDFRLSGVLPETSGGAQVLPGVPPEITGSSLGGAEIIWRDQGLNAFFEHYTGRGIASHADGIIAPLGRILPSAVVADFREGVGAWIAQGLDGEAYVILQPPAPPVSLAQAVSILLFAPQRVLELVGLRTER